MLLKTCEMFISIDLEKFLSFENNKNMNGKKNKYFSIDEKIYIETKLYGQQNIGQIEKHFESFKNEDKQIFLWINKGAYRRKILQENY